MDAFWIPAGQVVIAMPSKRSASANILARNWMLSKLSINKWRTMDKSAPERRKKDAASKVRDPVCTTKFFVSTTIPAYNALASTTLSEIGSTKY